MDQPTPAPPGNLPAKDEVLDELIKDAELVSLVASRLGRIAQPDLYVALGAAKRARDAGSADYDAVASLQRTLGTAIAGLAPITFADLKSGWDPFSSAAKRSIWAVIFGLICIVLIVGVAYGTLLYNRAASIHATLVEMKSSRAPEQLVRLVGLLQTNGPQLKKAMDSGLPDAFTEAVHQSLRDIKRADERIQIFYSLSGQVLEDATFLGPILRYIGIDDSRSAGLTADQKRSLITNVNNQQLVDQYTEFQKQIEASEFAPLDSWFNKVSLFNQIAQIRYLNPRTTQGLDNIIFKLQEMLNVLGSWILPALYGMLGAAVFHMRRYLDRTTPDPSWLRSLYRTFLGGFAGIIIVWIWTPTSAKAGDPAFASLTAFSIAFLMGFSTDVFFQALDRLVLNISQWLSGTQRTS